MKDRTKKDAAISDQSMCAAGGSPVVEERRLQLSSRLSAQPGETNDHKQSVFNIAANRLCWVTLYLPGNTLTNISTAKFVFDQRLSARV